ncbi:MAG: HAD family hydrolase [Candidatus Anstonellales archaeon]
MIEESQIEKINEIFEQKQKIAIAIVLTTFLTAFLIAVELVYYNLITTYKYQNAIIEKLIICLLILLSFGIFLTMIPFYKKLYHDLFLLKKIHSLTLEHANMIGGLIIFFYSFFLSFDILFLGNIQNDEKILYFSTYALTCLFYLLGKSVTINYIYEIKELYQIYNSLKKELVLIATNNYNEKLVSVDALKPGDIIIIEKEQRIPIDGIVSEGTSYLDYTDVTGENLLIKVYMGKKVYAGGVNKGDKIKIITSSTWDDSLLQKTIKKAIITKDVQTKDLAIFTKTTKLYYQSTILLIIFTTLLLIARFGINQYMLHLLVVTMFLLALPTSNLILPLIFYHAQNKLKSLGIKINSIVGFLKLRKIKTIVIDKTGIITTKYLRVNNVLPINSTQKHVLEIAYALERKINHHIAFAIREYAKEQKISYIFTRKNISINYSKGIGITGIAAKNVYAIGNQDILKLLEISEDKKILGLANFLKNTNSIILYVCENKRIIGLIGLAEKVEKTTLNIIKNWQKNKFEILIFSTESKEYTKRLMQILQLNEKNFVFVDSLEEKEKFIHNLKSKATEFLFIGEGIKDITAIANSEVSLVIQNKDKLTNNIADLQINNHEQLKNIEKAMNISKKLHETARINLFIMYVAALLVFTNYFFVKDIVYSEPLNSVQLNILLLLLSAITLFNTILN